MLIKRLLYTVGNRCLLLSVHWLQSVYRSWRHRPWTPLSVSLSLRPPPPLFSVSQTPPSIDDRDDIYCRPRGPRTQMLSDTNENWNFHDGQLARWLCQFDCVPMGTRLISTAPASVSTFPPHTVESCTDLYSFLVAKLTITCQYSLRYRIKKSTQTSHKHCCVVLCRLTNCCPDFD